VVFRIGHADEQSSNRATMTTANLRFCNLGTRYGHGCSEKSRWRRCANGIIGYRRQVWNAARNLYRRSIKKVLAGDAASARCRKQRAKTETRHVACNDSQVLEFNFAGPLSIAASSSSSNLTDGQDRRNCSIFA